MGGSGEPLGASWGFFGASWILRASWRLGGLLGSPGRLLGPYWRPSIKKEGGFFLCPPVGAFKWASWGPLGALLGRSWARLGALLGPSWGPLGPSWSHLEASEAHRKRKGEKAKNIDFLVVFEGCWPLGGLLGRLLGHLKPSWGGAGASWRHVVSYLGPCWAILSDLGGHLGLSEALLEPSWAKKDALTPRERPPPGPGEGGGGVSPFPKGKKGVGRKRAGTKPLTP